VRVDQDTLEILDGGRATGFRVRIVTEGEASLDQIRHLHVYTNGDRDLKGLQKDQWASLKALDVPGSSQMALNHERCRDLCSPTSTAAVVRYLGGGKKLDPIHLAEWAWDRGFDIFGNWVFNVAEAACELGQKWSCWVERLSGFEDIYCKLKAGLPVVVSIRGPLKGAPLPYAKGHLMVVTGYDADEKKVICMDPAFPSDQETYTRYDLSAFLEAWNRRGNVAYVFTDTL
jgi:hypothetical protein